ncbi:hypothetical protein [Candidatus Entotheonella palauensis]|uniref:Uncharacterized protein n=1 Tax=Candidatus Entotheonella gemina TaxID=1429439 RepID=W4LDA4_9BACT|nr:hypothetical protein [Candidatus Entotheonella palauensis]ETW95977.1 MAG: hypothetical protein ETSY2_47285 [Candidatus Entotheonella gemina]
MAAAFHQWLWRWFGLSLLCLPLCLGVGCADKSVLPSQPEPAESYAILKFSAAMQLVALDQQTIDTAVAIRTLRVRPGQHMLRFLHVNNGPEGSPRHAGQRTDPFVFEAFEGLIYEFEAKT